MDSISLNAEFSCSPETLYDAWLDSEEHAAFTGGDAVASSEVGGAFTAWDDYITGKNLELEPGKRILQSWRTTEFTAGDKDSLLEVLLEPGGKGTLVTLNHSNIPVGQGERYKAGWVEHYFEPMSDYFK